MPREADPVLLRSPGTATLRGGGRVPGETEEGDPCRSDDRVWAFTPPPPPQVPVLGQKPGATELIARQALFPVVGKRLLFHGPSVHPEKKKSEHNNKTTAHHRSGLTLGPTGSA